MLLYYIRHADPIYEPDSLTPLGERQAEALSRRLARFGLDELYSSDSVRAQRTARPTAELLKKEVTLLPWANEALVWPETTLPGNSGNAFWLFGLPEHRRLLVSPQMQALGDRWYTHPAFAGTPVAGGLARIRRESDAFLRSLGYAHDREAHTYHALAHNDRRVALFAHQGFGIAFLSCLLDIPYPQFAAHFDIGHSGMTVVYFAPDGEDTPRIFQLSNDSHIYADGLPTDYQGWIRI